MTKLTLSSLFLVFIVGCSYTTKPKQDIGFSKTNNLSDFDGCYENCSNTSDGSALTCLSGKFWPGRFSSDNLPDEIFVKSESSKELKVSAYKHGVEVVESVFIEGEQFTFKGGRIELRREYFASGATEPGNVFIGVGTGKTVLGLDAKGEGRIEQSTSLAGTAFLIIPLAITGSDVSKIRRKGASCNESQ